jgi:5-carboxymethyl-2-hydroxymuconic-semialdehyde dehydrogenase/aminomuconate-semialdehyde/2-hydroxymuconate-6-semialdehyde dehydrogenase
MSATSQPTQAGPTPAATDLTAFINGRFTAAGGEPHRHAVIDPATEQTVGELLESDAAQVDAAVRAARAAFDTGAWSRQSTDRRQACMLRVRDLILRNADALAASECTNTGIPYPQLRQLHIPGAAHHFQFYAELASQLKGELHQQRSGYQLQVSREPVGVAALISPWNGPVNMSCAKIAAALAFGNSCVLKPSEYTPLAFVRLMEIFREAGIPDGVVNMVNGRGAVTGAALASHPGIDLVSFTGGSVSGPLVNAAAARNLKRTTMELGGKSANIILESADLERALDGALAGIFTTNGQQCLAGSRILLQRSIAAAFIERFVERTRAIRIGNPFDPGTELGPMAYRAHMERVLAYAEVARAEGATLLHGGRRASQMPRGWYVEPTVVHARSNDLRICQEEVFGPLATFLEFDTLDEAIAIANASDFGLVAYLWTDALSAVTRATRALRAGTIWVNTTLVGDPRAPFGGIKQSGSGREGGIGSVEFYTELKSVVIPNGPAPVPRIGLG